MVTTIVTADTKKGAVVKANASKAPARATAKTSTESSKKVTAPKIASSGDSAGKVLPAKKAGPKAPAKSAPKVASKAASASAQKSSKAGSVANAATTTGTRAAGKAPAAKTAGKPRLEKAAASAKAGASAKAAPPAAKESGSASTKAATPARKPAAVSARPGVGLGAKAAPPKRVSEGYVKDERFLASQRAALERERVTYLEQAASLKAEAESLVEEMEPGDIQFDDESGEGGTVTVDRERDLALSAQALAAVEEIDHALAKLKNGTYGICENCGRLIPKARLEALPYARLCIDCKSGGLSRR
jgi:DnaK suppressor protein